MRPSETATDLLDALRAAVVPTEVPKGFYTVKQLAQQTGQTESVVLKHLSKMGCERRMFKVKCGSRVIPVPHYR